MRKPCCDKEAVVVNKGAWSKQEDQKLVDYISAHGEGCWRSLPTAAGLLRCGKSCRLRWINYLRPDIKRGNFAQDEEDLIIKLHALLGNRWSLIAGRLPGRTDNEVKNYWNSHLRKKLVKMGIDPNNHKPHQHLPRPPTSPTSQITNSSGSMDDDDDDDVGVSYAVVDQDASRAPQAALDLNLDLTIAMPPSASPAADKPPFIKRDDVNVGSGDPDQLSSPTLVLFR